ncbi:MAG: class I adenylate-forming enzyme family protein [Actinomycetota bacterium]
MKIFHIDPAAHQAGVRRAASWLQANIQGDRVLWITGTNHPGLLELAHAGLGLGITTAITPPYLPDADATAYLLGPHLRVHDPSLRPWSDARQQDLPSPRSRPMMATSGTSGHPRMVEPVMLDEADADLMHQDEYELWQPDPAGSQLVCSPLFHSAGYRSATSALLAGTEVTLMERFDASSVLGAFTDLGVTGAFLVPTHLRRLLELDPAPIPRRPRRLLHAGEPCPPRVLEAATEILGPLGEFYGATEGQFTLLEPTERRAYPGSVGRARSGRRLEIRDQAADGVGVVWCHTPDFTRFTYRGDRDATAKAWDADAFTVGDLGTLDEDGYLTLVSRREDLIISGGVNIYPAMIERALCEHPSVRAAVALGLPDERWGQRLEVVLETEDDDLRGWVDQRLTGPYRPKALHRRQELPRTPSGKVDRACLLAGLVEGESGSPDESP